MHVAVGHAPGETQDGVIDDSLVSLPEGVVVMTTKVMEPRIEVEPEIRHEPSMPPVSFRQVLTLVFIGLLAIAAIVLAVLRPWETETSSYGIDGKDLAIERVLDGSPYGIDGKDAAIERAAETSPYVIDGKDLAIARND